MINKFMNFIEKSPTAFHVVENFKQILTEAGFEDIDEKGVVIKKGGNYYKIRNGSSIIAFKIPSSEKFSSFRITTAHSDSPCYKIKANPVFYKLGYTQLNVAPYGGMIHSTFLDRALKIAGRVVYLDNENKLQTELISFNDVTVMIPNVAIHFNREINNGYQYKPAKDIVPILGLGEIDFFKLIKEKFNISGEILAHDLFVCSAEKPYIWGVNDEFIASPRLDDLECAFASITALIDSEIEQGGMALVFNNEEVGSSSYMGANSDFLYSVLVKIQEDLNLKKTELFEFLRDSFAIQGDNAHALHPNYTEFYDLNNFTMLNGGVVIKYSPNQKYTSDGLTSGMFMKLCRESGIKYQKFENHSNVAGGSTLGNILNSQVSILSVDIGLPQFAMHSSFETAGTRDFIDLIKVLKTHFEYKK